MDLVKLEINEPIDEMPPDFYELQNLEELVINAKIDSFPDLSRFPKLKSLEISSQQISPSFFTGTKLEKLKLTNTKIDHFDILDYPDLVDLKTLDLIDNKLTKIEIDGMTNLESLYLSNNMITDLDLTHLENLKILICNYNKIKTCNLALPNLIALSLKNNFLKSISLSELQNLVSVDITNNYLSQIDIGILKKIEYLNLGNNSLEKLDFNLPKLILLNLNDNYKIKEIPVGLSESLNLQKLYLGNNSIDYFPPFLSNLNLQEFTITENPVCQIDSCIFTDPNEIHDFIYENTYVIIYGISRHIDDDGISISFGESIPDDFYLLKKIKTMTIINYKNEFPDLSRFPKLKYLYFETLSKIDPAWFVGTNLKTISFENCVFDEERYSVIFGNNRAPELVNLKVIIIENCRINEIQIFGYPDLETLYINKNDITKIEVSGLKIVKLELDINPITELILDTPKLEYLDISSTNLRYNQISEIVKSLVNLEFLNISDNNLSEIPNEIYLLKKLETLVSRQNKIWHIDEDISNLDNLRVLNLSVNNLSELPNFILISLTDLYISHNKLVKLPETLISSINLSNLDISNNLFEGFQEFMPDLNLKMLSIKENPVCISEIYECEFWDDEVNEFILSNIIEEPVNNDIYRYQKACRILDAETIKGYYLYLFEREPEGDLNDVCKEIDNEITENQQYFEKYDDLIIRCVEKGEDGEECIQFLNKNQCTSLLSGKNFKELLMGELYMYNDGEQKYCFELSDLIKMDKNPYTNLPFPISKAQASDLYKEFKKWIVVKKQSVVPETTSQIYATLASELIPNDIPENIITVSLPRIRAMIRALYKVPEINLNPDEINLIVRSNNPNRLFLSMLLRIAKIEDAHKDTRKVYLSEILKAGIGESDIFGYTPEEVQEIQNYEANKNVFDRLSVKRNLNGQEIEDLENSKLYLDNYASKGVDENGFSRFYNFESTDEDVSMEDLPSDEDEVLRQRRIGRLSNSPDLQDPVDTRNIEEINAARHLLSLDDNTLVDVYNGLSDNEVDNYAMGIFYELPNDLSIEDLQYYLNSIIMWR